MRGDKNWFETIDEMQKVFDEWLITYNTKRPHQGRGMNGRTPLKAFADGIRKQPSEPTRKAKGEKVTTSTKHASMTNENRPA